MWSNNANHTRSMSRHHVTLRGLGSGGGAVGCGGGLTARHLHLDQVHIIFRPNADIGPTEFIAGDDNTKTWRAETAHLFVRTMPGEQHLLFSSGTSQDGVSLQGEISSPHHTHRDPARSLVYSAALSLVPDVEGNEDYWCRTYRPVRDIPLANYVMNVSEMTIELMFPLLLHDSPFIEVPNYRILKVLCEFSVDH